MTRDEERCYAAAIAARSARSRLFMNASDCALAETDE